MYAEIADRINAGFIPVMPILPPTDYPNTTFRGAIYHVAEIGDTGDTGLYAYENYREVRAMLNAMYEHLAGFVELEQGERFEQWTLNSARTGDELIDILERADGATGQPKPVAPVERPRPKVGTREVYGWGKLRGAIAAELARRATDRNVPVSTVIDEFGDAATDLKLFDRLDSDRSSTRNIRSSAAEAAIELSRVAAKYRSTVELCSELAQSPGRDDLELVAALREPKDDYEPKEDDGDGR